MDVVAGSTDVTTYFALRLAADGTDATALTVTTFDLTYVRTLEEPAAKVDASALADQDSAHTDNAAIEIDATNMPGVYRVDWPDAAFAAGAREVILTVKVATCFTEHLRVNLTAVPANVTHAAGTAWGSGAITAASVAADAANKVADHVRRRTQANVEASSDGDTLGISSLYGMIQMNQESNLVDNPGFLTIYQTDGTTELAQKAVTTDASGEPVTGIS